MIKLSLYVGIFFLVLLLIDLGRLWFVAPTPREVNWYEVLGKVVQAAAVIVGAAWAYQSFVLFRESAWNIQLSHSFAVLQTGPTRILCIDIQIKNTGKVAVNLPADGTEGLVLSLGIVPPPTNVTDVLDPLDESMSEPSKKATSLLAADVGYEGKITKRDPDPLEWKWINVLRHYSSYYTLEPGVEYHEREYVVVNASLIYSRVYLVADDGMTLRDSLLMTIT
jgi:hypothetical protein